MKGKERRQVIIGNSAASLSAIKAIREMDKLCPITVISAENCNAYSPVFLTYLLRGALSKKDLFITGSDFYKDNGVVAIFGNKAVHVDPKIQQVHLNNDSTVEYDNLLIATGASPISPVASMKGLDNVFSLRTITDAEKILKCAKMSKEVLIVGGGLIGMQVANAFVGKKTKLTIMEWSKQVLPESIDVDCAAILQKEIESCGISVILGEKVVGIEKCGKKAIIVSDSGKEVAADMVIVGIGLKPNVQLAERSGIKLNRGILIDSQLRTNFENIFAAGDVSEGENLVTGKREVLPTWINACRQGKIAGQNMAASSQIYEGGIRETITTIFGLSIVAVGLVKAQKEEKIIELQFSDTKRKIYRKILLNDNRIVGAVLLNNIVDAGILGNLIRNKKNISSFTEQLLEAPIDMRKLLTLSDIN